MKHDTDLLDKWDKQEKQEYTFLDSIDLEPIIQEMKYETVYNIMRRISDEYEAKYLEQDEVEDVELFFHISEEEFTSYIYNRYGIHAYQVHDYYFRL